MSTDKDTGAQISTDDARGGITGQGVRYVLVFGIGGAIIAMAVVAMVLRYFS